MLDLDSNLIGLWSTSDNAFEMLDALSQADEEVFQALVPQIHMYLIACCRKIEYLIPQADIRRGLEVAANYTDGKASLEEIIDVDWYVEAVAFAIEYADTEQDIRELKSLIADIRELNGLPYEEARQLLLDAAYFADRSIVYPTIRSGPFQEKLFKSKFMDADLLREYVKLEA